jgi:hypothetical protein
MISEILPRSISESDIQNHGFIGFPGGDYLTSLKEKRDTKSPFV